MQTDVLIIGPAWQPPLLRAQKVLGLPLSTRARRPSLWWRPWVLLVLAFSFCFAPPLRAQETVVNLDPTATRIDFTLGATMHTVHGSFKLKSGEIRFDPATGKASGVVILDATSGNTDNSSRDKRMHAEILESARFPEITFTPSQVKGAIAPQGTSQVEVTGVIRLHGRDHDVTLAMSVERAANGLLRASTTFAVPYVQWGLKNPGNFFLHVSDTVNVDAHATGPVAPVASSVR